MFGNEKIPPSFNGDGNNTLPNGAGFVGGEGVKTGISVNVNGAGGGKTGAAIVMKSEFCYSVFAIL